MADPQWIDPWLKIREKTALRNELATVAENYAAITRAAIRQFKFLQERTTKPETMQMLTGIIEWSRSKSNPLFDRIETLDSDLKQMTALLEVEYHE